MAPPVEPGPIETAASDPTPELATAYLTELFQGHGIACGRHEAWVTPNFELPGIRGVWFPGEQSGQLDIQVMVERDLLIVESFAGAGEPHERLRNALGNFTLAAFHVLLSVLWKRHDPGMVETRTLQVGDVAFAASIGNVVTRATAGAEPTIPSALLDAVERAIRSERLAPRLHWFSVFFGNVKGELTFEPLHDNEPWAAGLEALKSLPWEPTEGFYTVRLFVMLRPATP